MTGSSSARRRAYGMMASQMKNFLDQTGALWANGALVGKVGSVFTSTATQHGGQESTILNFHTVLLHQGMVIVGLPYTFAGQSGLRGGEGRLSLRRVDHRRHGRQPQAERAGTRRRPLPGSPRGRDRRKAGALTADAAFLDSAAPGLYSTGQQASARGARCI